MNYSETEKQDNKRLASVASNLSLIDYGMLVRQHIDLNALNKTGPEP